MPPRTRRMHEPEISEDEAPEEVSLSSGKASADVRRLEERRSKAIAAEEKKAKRKTLTERSQRQHVIETRRGDVAGPAEDAAEDVEDLLPAHVLEALAERKRMAAEAEPSEHGGAPVSLAQRQTLMVSEALRQQHQGRTATKRRQREFVSLKKGPVSVMVLTTAARLAAAGRNNFKREKLLGQASGLKRSYDMNRRPTMVGQKPKPAAKFV